MIVADGWEQGCCREMFAVGSFIEPMHQWPPEGVWLLLVGVCFGSILLFLRLFGVAGLWVYSAVAVIAVLIGVSLRSLRLGALCILPNVLPLLGAIVSSRFGTVSFGKVMGLIGPFSTVSAIGPYMMARIVNSSGSYDQALYIFLGLAVPAALAMFFLQQPETHKHKAGNREQQSPA